MRLILIGYGNVGQSFTSLLSARKWDLVKNYGLDPKIVAVVDRKGSAVNPKGLNLDRLLQVKREKGTVAAYHGFGSLGASVADVIRSVEAEFVIETTPTNIKTGEPCLSNIREALRHKRHTITTNKSVALALPALMELASYNKALLKFSGTVGAGMPILDLGKRLASDRITSVRGILNGTTNYILTKMEEGLSFDQALKDAQRLGYAEADPSMDVDGVDTACKLTIIANWVMGRRVTLSDVQVSGIRGTTLENVGRAGKQGLSIRLIGQVNEGLSVKPTEVPRRDPLCVSGVLNAVTFSLEMAGDITISGRGAGGSETASSILRDLLTVKFGSS